MIFVDPNFDFFALVFTNTILPDLKVSISFCQVLKRLDHIDKFLAGPLLNTNHPVGVKTINAWDDLIAILFL